MLLLHGLGATKALVLRHRGGAEPRGYRVHALDLPGFGSSTQAGARALRRAVVRQRVVGAMDALGIDRAHLVGNSMGGRVAIEVGLRTPSASAGWRCSVPRWRSSAATGTRSCASRAPSSGCSRTARPRADRAPVLGAVRRPRPGRPERGRHRGRRVRAHLPLGRARGWPSWLGARAIYLERPFGRDGFYPRLRELEPPALFVWSSHDRLIPAAFRRHVGEWLPGGRADRARGLRPRAAGRAPGADQRPARSASSPASTRSAPGAGPAGGAPQVLNGPSPWPDRPPSWPAPEAGRAGPQSTAARPLKASSRPHPRGRPRRARPRLHPRDAAAPVAAGLAVLPRRGARPGQHARGGPGAAVGNHSGGNLTPDTTVFTLAFSTYFGVERPFHQLAHNLVLSMPGLSFLRKYGTVAASPENARKALEAGAAVLVYPGGDYEVHRPGWERHRVDFDGRKGFIRLALEQDVPIVPGRRRRRPGDRAVPLARRAPGARCWASTARCRLKVLPISLALPWGLNVGDMLGHIPLPAKITVEALPPIHLREEFGPEPDVDEVYDHVLRRDAGDARRAGRRAALPGDRMRVAERSRSPRRPRSCGSRSPTPRAAWTSCPASPAGRSCRRRRAAGLGARYRMLMRVGSAEVGGLIEVVEFAPERDLAWTSVTGIDQRGRWRLRRAARAGRASSCGCRTASPAAGIFGWLAEQLAAPTVRGHLGRTPAPAQAPGRARAAARPGGGAAPPGPRGLKALPLRSYPLPGPLVRGPEG